MYCKCGEVISVTERFSGLDWHTVFYDKSSKEITVCPGCGAYLREDELLADSPNVDEWNVDTAFERTVVERIMESHNAKGVETLLVALTGSRSKGYDTMSSDYDIVAIYGLPKRDYITVIGKREQVRDYLFRADDGRLVEVRNVDIKHLLYLLAKGNSQVAEWMYSRFLYRSQNMPEIPVDKFYMQGRYVRHYYGLLGSYIHALKAKQDSENAIIGDVPKAFANAVHAYKALEVVMSGNPIADVLKPSTKQRTRHYENTAKRYRETGGDDEVLAAINEAVNWMAEWYENVRTTIIGTPVEDTKGAYRLANEIFCNYVTGE